MRIGERQLRAIIREELIRSQRGLGRGEQLDEVSWKKLLIAAGLSAAALAGCEDRSSDAPKEKPEVVASRVAHLDASEKASAQRDAERSQRIDKALHSKVDKYSKSDLDRVWNVLQKDHEKPAGERSHDDLYKKVYYIYKGGQGASGLDDIKPEDRPTKLFNALMSSTSGYEKEVGRILGR